MKYDVMLCKIIAKKQLTADIFDLTVEAGELAKAAQPGQFAHLYVPGKTLRRPISICEINRAKETLRFVFQIRGEGTAWIAGACPGETLDILAPLGNGYSLGNTRQKAVFVGGGIGVPPLLEAAKHFGQNATVLTGFRNEESVILKEDFEKNGNRVLVATDDGSFGYHGLVTDLLNDLKFDVLFACGPSPMLKSVCKIAAARGVPCQISLEERMACGVGACLGCACRLKKDGREFYGHVCKDGPVFDSETVVWEG
ncbi:dihydroorotate dehydrogenase electron transfer subunit [Caproiciproducens faecalis]|uniref:Dihydroorotate dehydrogenase B (NAD(+)), electron transfer subunit n=1 Tax=Caproiciproducens faecalis TaxID=2820301 RepID=A0ABS7DN41_9FIRM|nr:dihydroorotate dehydrogenase electron transfer subunit [Caproiciproducens faecalis]MBW7572534.1 dihydroorotate dehydrogenase electron transfer subunit [Caproiciproducens faecalis]